MDYGVTFTGLDNQHNAARNLNGAAQEARIKPVAIQSEIKLEKGRLGAEKNDNGATNKGPSANAGAVNMWSNTCKAVGGMAVTALVTATAGPVAGAIVGMGLAAKDAVGSMSPSAGPQPQGGYYTLDRSLKESRKGGPDKDDGFQYANPADDHIIGHYPSACDNRVYANGFALPPQPSAIAMMGARKTDSAEERLSRERIGTLQSEALDLDREAGTVRGLAPKMIDGAIASGPPAPKIAVGPGFSL